MAGGTDFRPTDTEVTLTNHFEQELAKAGKDYGNLMTNELTAFNHTLTEEKVTPIAETGAPAPAHGQSE